MIASFRKGCCLLLLTGWLLLCGPGSIDLTFAKDDMTIGGHLKSLNLLVRDPATPDQDSGEISSNRLRLDASGPLFSWGNWDVALEQLVLYADPPQLTSLPGDNVNRRLDLEKNWNQNHRWSGRLEVDRCNLTVERPWGDISVGRQAIGFGRITLSSPLDIIAPFPPDALDTEVRPGVDALRVSRYGDRVGQLQGVVVLGSDSRHNSYLATLVQSLTGVDLLALGGQLRDRPMIGGGVAGSVGGMGLRGELAWYKGTRVGEPDGDLHDDFIMAGVEADYRFDIDLSLTVEYLYNGIGTSRAENYPVVWQSAPYQEGLGFLSGRDYLLAAASHQFHPLVEGSLLGIWNLQDDSFLLRPLVDLSLADNCVLQLFWTFLAGRSPQTVQVDSVSTTIPRSEFDSVAESGGIFLKYFF